MRVEDMLGLTARDRISGFTGEVTGYAGYMTGCRQALLVPKVKEDGGHQDCFWYDEDRLEILDVPRVGIEPEEASPRTPGADMAAPGGNRG